MWPFAKTSSKPQVRDVLSARPVRRAGVEVLADGMDGGARLTVELQARGVGKWLLRMPARAKKTFELDAIGLFVWENCDGKTSVEQIVKRLAKRYSLNLREAQVPTMKFLEMLSRRGLVGLAGEKKR